MVSGPYKHYINSLLQLFAYNSLITMPSHLLLFISLNPPATSGLGTIDYGYFTDKETKPQRT